ncbi:hypothetical protein [Nostoc sp.]|uniref:hypothetical protein n=1 Tax=Nostoc sp. TaxID=1180 RepID=UPI002FFB28F1
MKTDLIRNRFIFKRGTSRPRGNYQNPEIQSVGGVNIPTKPTILGVSENNSNFMGLVYFASPSSDAALSNPSTVGLVDDEPFYVRRLRIKGKFEPLNEKEKNVLMTYYRGTEKQQDKDTRSVLNEGYKSTKRILGLGRS